MRISILIACICLLCVYTLRCNGGYIRKRPSGCYYSRRQCEAKCCCSEKRCEPMTVRGRTYYKCVTVDCGSLPDPTNGHVSTIDGTTFESQAVYSCNDGYRLSFPEATRICLSTSHWSGRTPLCEPEPVLVRQECPILEPPCNAMLLGVLTNPQPGDIVTYSCNEGFELHGVNTRTCQEDYTWDGSAPCCVKTCRQMPVYGDGFDGSTYHIIFESSKWEYAKSLCEADGAHIVEINTAAEQAHLENLYEEGVGDFWTNGNDIDNDGIWTWPIDGRDFTGGDPAVYDNWRPGEPSMSGCMYFDGSTHDWLAIRCNYTFLPLCECPPSV